MLGKEKIDPERSCAAWEIIKGGIAFAQRDRVLGVIENGEEVAKTPNTRLIYRHGGGTALLPKPAERTRIGEPEIWHYRSGRAR